ncbi:MAG: DnaB-like helicase N-terminal domain-containing protein, partial [Ilumatobacteraceae bacterium]
MASDDGSRADRQAANRTSQRVPPHNLDAEASLLGTMLLSREAVGIALERGVRSEEFYKPSHQHIYDAIRALNTAGEPVDPVTVADELRRANLLEGVGGLDLLLSLQNSTPAITSAERYAKIVRDTARLRRLISAAGDIAEIAYSEPDDVDKAVDDAESRIFDISESESGDNSERVGLLINETMEKLEDRFNNKDALTGVPTGFAELDKVLL